VSAKPAKLPDWLPAAEAAALLGVKRRQLQMRERQGYIEKRVLPRSPTESVGRVEYSRADIEALLRGAPNTHAREIPAEPLTLDQAIGLSDSAMRANGKPSTALALRSPLRGDTLQHFLAAVLAENPIRHEPPAFLRPWLTLAEAVDMSGLPAPYLLTRAERGWDAAVNVGRRKGGRWRFSREGLVRG
jgi:hypothetical protein